MKIVKSKRRATLGTSRKRRFHAGRGSYSSRDGSGDRPAARLRTTTRSNRRTAVKGNQKVSAQDAQRQRVEALYQAAVRNFALASRALQKQNYDRARELFEKLAKSEVTEVAERARVHLRLCQQRLAQANPAPKTAEDHYTLGVVALNARALDVAIEHLSKARKLAPNQEHIVYALAAAHAVRGDVDAALEHLKAAIGLRPANRIQARKDEDFRGLAGIPRFRQLAYPNLS